MGLLTECFTAEDDARAAAVLATGPAAAGLPTVHADGIEPYVQFGTLEEILTGRPYEQVAAAQSDPEALADLLRELTGLTRSGRSLYCWLSV